MKRSVQPGPAARAVLSAALLWTAVPSVEAATLLVVAKTDDTVALIDSRDGSVRATLPTGRAPHEVIVSPDGSTAVVANYGLVPDEGTSLTVVDVTRAVVRATIDLGARRRPHGLAWIGGDRLAVTAEGTAHLLVVDLAAGRVVSEIETGRRLSHMVAVTPDGRRAFVPSIVAGTVTVIDLVDASVAREVPTGAGAADAAAMPDGREVWIANRSADSLTVLDARTLERREAVPCRGFPTRVAISPDGARVIVAASGAGEIVTFDGATRRELRRAALPERSQPGGLAISPNGRFLWVSLPQADQVVMLRADSLEIVERLATGREPDGLAFSPVTVRPHR